MSIDLINIQLEGYKKLWSAVLLNAKKDLSKETKKYKFYQQQIDLNNRATHYWFNNDDNEEIGSFKWICEFLNKDFKKIRKQIFKHIEKTNQKR